MTVEKACDSLGVSLTTSGRVLESHLAALDESKARTGNANRQPAKKKPKSGGLNELPVFDIQSLSQAVIDTQAREAIKDLFPNIPPNDLHVIVGRSFQKVRVSLLLMMAVLILSRDKVSWAQQMA